MSANTLFLRLEGPLQAWGDQQSKFVVRRTTEAPTKSGVIGMLCAALGVSRAEASEDWLPKLGMLNMGVRIDSPGVRWWDYHTVGAGMQMRTAEGGPKAGAMLTRREYLCDASFLVALQGEPGLIAEIEAAIKAPKWPLYLGRKSCPPSRPLLFNHQNNEMHSTGYFPDLLSALQEVPWPYRLRENRPKENEPIRLVCLLDWKPTPEKPEAPDDALIWYDVPVTFDPPAHRSRFIIRRDLRVGAKGEVKIADKPSQNDTPAPTRIRTDYDNSTWGKIRDRRLADDYHLCVFCKAPATTGQHISYRRAGKDHNMEALADERVMRKHLENVRSLCRLCHDAVTMIEYGFGMGLDRINPEELRWRDIIIQKRDEIIKFRSLETRRRRLAGEEV
ncbi:MAG: type I-E CRISPR-associated protein Cas5/CasD [Nitrospiraceae bacterium]|nr:type I-E CRISPR-associated protein Cas5/CasD [Nitrospiraceae bacterium]